MVMTTRKPEISVQARCSVAVIMCSLGFSLSRCHSLTVANNTRKAIRYPSTESAVAVSWKLAYLEIEYEKMCLDTVAVSYSNTGDVYTHHRSL